MLARLNWCAMPRPRTSVPYGFLRVGAACPRITVADPAANAAATLAVLRQAEERFVQVMVCPEMGLTGYTAGDLFLGTTLVRAAQDALEGLLDSSKRLTMVIVVGLPVTLDGRLFNAAALMQSGKLLGVVPKTFLPGYREYYEERWFSSARDALSREVRLAGQDAPFGTDLLFPLHDDPSVVLGLEICEDLWAPIPPSSRHAIAGATVILNPSASNDLVGKAAYRRDLVKQQSARTLAAYVYANAGVHESTTDMVFDGQLLIAENGVLLAEGERFKRGGAFVATDVDVERLVIERARQTSYADAVHPRDATPYRKVAVAAIASHAEAGLIRRIEQNPFVPEDAELLVEHCREVLALQTAGLAKRLEHTGIRRVTIGLSGGLDSTLAFLVALNAFAALGLPKDGVIAITMPGFGTTERTLAQARRLAAAGGVSLREIDIRAACTQHIKDIGLGDQDRQSATFQNVQARERTQVLMDLANKESGLVVGTGDLSELALGFATYGGDHLSMYNVNAGVPKTLVRRLVQFVADSSSAATGTELCDTLRAVLATPISPELVPPAGDGSAGETTESLIGPYELHDFFLHGLMRLGAGPRKLQFLARQAFGERYDAATVKTWLRVFIERFFANQFKRSALPDGPKVGSVSLSPRGDWRMPSDASAAAWLAELD
jgi:NAD+ synthase (glutamine-hydrolysing)